MTVLKTAAACVHTRPLTAPKLQMICSPRYLLEFYSHSTYFSVHKQIDNKKPCINPRRKKKQTQSKTAFVQPGVLAFESLRCLCPSVGVLSTLTREATESFFTLAFFFLRVPYLSSLDLSHSRRPGRSKAWDQRGVQKIKLPTIYN